MFLLVLIRMVILASCAFQVSAPERKAVAPPQKSSSPPAAQVERASLPAGRFFSAFGCGFFLPPALTPVVWSCPVLVMTSGVLSPLDLKVSPLSLEPEAKTFAPPSGTIFSVIHVFFSVPCVFVLHACPSDLLVN